MEKGATLNNLPIEFLQRGKYQPRRDFEPEALQDLADSIHEHGIIEPIVVRKIAADKYEIVAGERRWRAAQLAGLDKVPCLIKDYDEQQTAAVAIIENIQRSDLNPIEEAQAYQNLKEVFGYTDDEIAQQVSKSRTKITNTLRLLKLAEEVRNTIQKGILSEGHGKLLAGLTHSYQINLAKETMEKGWSVRQLEQAVRKIQHKVDGNNKKANFAALERALADHIGCPVKVEFNEEQGGKGRLVFDCHNLDVLEGIFAKMKFKYDELE